MADDHVSRAREFEAARDWDKAEVEWRRAARDNHPGAVARLNRARQARELTAELLHEAKVAIDAEDLHAAAGSISTLAEMVPGDHSEARALRRQWRGIRAAARKRIRQAEGTLAVVSVVLLVLTEFVFAPRLGIHAWILAIFLFVMARLALALLVPSLRRLPPMRAIKARRARRRPRRGEAPVSPSGSSRIERWRRAAEREKNDYLA